MEILDYIDLAITDPEHLAAAITKYISERKDMVASLDVKIRVSICKSQRTLRAGKAERQDTLAQLITLSGQGVWDEVPGYKFDFTTGQYLWNDRALYATASEAVALYQTLVRKQVTTTWPAFYANMKRKFGSDFLKGVIK